ncbi:acyl carrier protein [Amycolatopsis sp. H20-H5]|uniref:acyl carrier protein n=1 Tax=Amycolatopsis sp. H20-H5 TaxID=3046309 RepID=UPI002DBBAC81|nr:acyl carrier protein [Amycolatopsis sp. H20-H5]MEC3979492.1 acyl carrier protein [Amycolatopsis sp. H20-H5]
MSIETIAELDREEMRVLLAETVDADLTEVTDDADFVKTLAVDSLMALEVIVVLERRYGVKFSESEMRSVRTLRSAHELVSAKLRGRP